jgi:hypothetical protein
MDQAEASGKTVEDALNRALAKLGASRDEVEFVVLDEGSGGLFGRGSREAIVRERVATPQGGDRDRGPIDTRIPRGSQRGGRPPGPGRGDRGPAPAGGGAPRGDRDRGRGTRPPRPSGRGGLEAATPKLTEQDFMRAPRFDEETSASRPCPCPARGGRGPRPEPSRLDLSPRASAPRGRAPDRRGHHCRGSRFRRAHRGRSPEITRHKCRTDYPGTTHAG